MLVNIKAELWAPGNQIFFGGRSGSNKVVFVKRIGRPLDHLFLRDLMRGYVKMDGLCLRIGGYDHRRKLLSVVGYMKSGDSHHLRHLLKSGWVARKIGLRCYGFELPK